MAVPVDIYATDDSNAATPIENAVIGILDPNTYAIITMGTTDSQGHASFLLPGSASPGTQYQVRTFAPGVYFQNPSLISVIDPLTGIQTNSFDVKGHMLSDDVGLPTLSTLCRVWGFLINVDGSPMKNRLVRISANPESGFQYPKVFHQNMVAGEYIEVRTDDNGLLVVDLLQGGKFDVSFAGEDDVRWSMVIPTVASANFSDLVHPYPQTMTWDQTVAPGNVVTIHVGDILAVQLFLHFSDLEVISTDVAKWIDLFISDPCVDMGLDSGPGMVALTGMSPGTATVTTQMKPFLPTILPDPTLTFRADVLTVNVIP